MSRGSAGIEPAPAGITYNFTDWFVPRQPAAVYTVRLDGALRLRAPALLLAVPLLIGITFISFIVIQLAPGGPLDFLSGESPDSRRRPS